MFPKIKLKDVGLKETKKGDYEIVLLRVFVEKVTPKRKETTISLRGINVNPKYMRNTDFLPINLTSLKGKQL